MNSYLSILNTNTEILRATFLHLDLNMIINSETSSFKKFSFSNLLFFETEEKIFH